MAEAKIKAAPKAAAKKAAIKKAPAKAKKAPAKKKPAAKTKAKASTKAKTRARPKAVDTGRNALLAGLGVYGKAYDQVPIRRRLIFLSDDRRAAQVRASGLQHPAHVGS